MLTADKAKALWTDIEKRSKTMENAYFDQGASLLEFDEGKGWRHWTGKSGDCCGSLVEFLKVVGSIEKTQAYRLIDAAKVRRATGIEMLPARVGHAIASSSRSGRNELDEKLATSIAGRAMALAEEENDERPVMTLRHVKAAAGEFSPGGKPKNRTDDSASGVVNVSEPDTSAKTDAIGLPVPPALDDAFSAVGLYDDILSVLRRVVKDVRAIGKGPGGEWLEGAVENLKTAISSVEYAKPYTTCPTCKSGPNRKSCRDCRQTGYVIRRVWELHQE